MLTNFLPFSCLGLHGYLQLHPGRLVDDMNKSPEKRPRMSTKSGTLQTLTTELMHHGLQRVLGLSVKFLDHAPIHTYKY